MLIFKGFIEKLGISLFFIIFFYHYAKSFIYSISYSLAIWFGIAKHYPLEVAKGSVELPLMVCFHLLFCALCIYLFSVPIKSALSFSYHSIFPLIVLGVLLGVGLMGFSSLLCRAVIECLRSMDSSFPQDVSQWLIMVRSGWVRHYFHTLDVLPFYIALLIVCAQVCCEELMFRGVWIHYFSSGPMVSIIMSTCLFMGMQVFHMPSRLSVIFPLVGSMVIGLVHGILYSCVPSLIPLMVSHATFFLVAVL